MLSWTEATLRYGDGMVRIQNCLSLDLNWKIWVLNIKIKIWILFWLVQLFTQSGDLGLLVWDLLCLTVLTGLLGFFKLSFLHFFVELTVITLWLAVHVQFRRKVRKGRFETLDDVTSNTFVNNPSLASLFPLLPCFLRCLRLLPSLASFLYSFLPSFASLLAWLPTFLTSIHPCSLCFILWLHSYLRYPFFASFLQSFLPSLLSYYLFLYIRLLIRWTIRWLLRMPTMSNNPLISPYLLSTILLKRVTGLEMCNVCIVDLSTWGSGYMPIFRYINSTAMNLV